jgi:hypothetical protein
VWRVSTKDSALNDPFILTEEIDAIPALPSLSQLKMGGKDGSVFQTLKRLPQYTGFHYPVGK